MRLIVIITIEMNEKIGDYAPWEESDNGVQGAIDESEWQYQLGIVRDQILDNAEAMKRYGEENGL